MTEAAATDATGWSSGDEYSLTIAAAFMVVACIRHWRVLLEGTDRKTILKDLFTNSLGMGPLLMIIFDPLNKVLHWFPGDLLQIVMRDSRITLIIAALLAVVDAIGNLLKSRCREPT